MKGKILLIFGMFFLILSTPSFAHICCDAASYTCSNVDEVCVSTASFCISVLEGESCGVSCTTSADCNTITPPTYSLNSTNSTLAGTPIEFRLKWQDAFGLSKAITGLWNGSAWVNATSWCSLSGTTSWCNQTLVVNSTIQTLWWKQYANDTSNNWATSTNYSLTTTSAGTIPPTWSNMGSNVTNNTAVNTGTPINISAQWNDNIALSMYVNSSKINNSGSWSNGTWTAFTTGNWSNFTIIFPSQQGSNITVKIYANDSSNNQNVTGTWFWWNVTPSDSTPPTFSNPSINTTCAGKPVNISTIISDGTALSGYIFSTNNTGTWVNTTWASLTSGGLATNITTLNSTAGTVVNYTWYANDTASPSNWATQLNSTTTTDCTPPLVTISSPTNTTYSQKWVWANVTLDEVGSWCGVSLNNTANQTLTNSTGNYNLNLSVPSEGANNVTFCCNDTSNNMNCSAPTVYFTIDNTPPTYSLNSTNTTLAGAPTLFSLNWTDNVNLSGYIFQFCNGTWNGVGCIGTTTPQTNQLLPNNATNKAYKMNADINPCGGNPDSATTDFTDANYNSVNTSNNAYFSMTTQAPVNDLDGDCIHSKFTFNVTAVNTSPITSIYYCMEGYYDLSGAGGHGMYGWWRNTTGWYENFSQTFGTTPDSTYCINRSSNIDSYILSDGTFQVGIYAFVDGEGGAGTTISYTDIVNVTVTYTNGWANDTWNNTNWDSATEWSNVTKTVNSMVGANISWCVYANDTSNNWNGTSCSNPFTYTTTDGTPPTYSLNSTNTTLVGAPTLFSLNWTDNVNLSGYIFQFCNGTWNGVGCIGTTTPQTNQLLPNTTINKAFYSGDNLATTSTPASATTEYDDAGYDNINVTDSKSNLVTVVSATVLAKQEHERYAFNLTASEIAIATVNWIQYCIRANVTTTLAGSLIDYYYNNASATWVSDQAWTLDTVQTTKCKNFTTNSLSTDIFNSISGLVQFGMTCKAQPAEGVESTVYCRTDYVNVTVNWNYTTNGWANDTWNNTNWDSATEWSNVTKTVNSMVEANISWCVYANDTSNNWNSSSCSNPFTYTTTDGTTPTYSLNSTNSTVAGTPISHNLNWTDNVGLSGYIFQFCNGTWNGVSCLASAPVIYNFSGITSPSTTYVADWKDEIPSNPNIFGTEATTPDYGNLSLSDNQEWWTSTSTGSTPNSQKYRFKINELPVTISNLTVLWEGYGIDYIGSSCLTEDNYAYLYIWNFTSSSWLLVGSHTSSSDSTIMKNYTSNINDFVNASGYLFMYAKTGTPGSNYCEGNLYTDFVKVETTTNGQVYTWTSMTGATNWSNVTKTVNSTVGATIAWCVYANDTSNNWNGTSCQTPFSYTTTGGNLTVTLINPGAGSTTNVDQNFTFTVNATVNCTIANCGNVYGTVRYNASSANPDTDINATAGATPFYNTSGAILQSCVLSEDQSCQLNWTINATGNTIVGYKIGVLFNTSYNQNHTDNATINIIECTESMNIGWSSLDFTNSNPNTPASSNNATGNDNKIYNITNTGTCTLTVWIKGTDLQNDTLPYPNTIGVGNLSWSNISSVYASANPRALIASYFLVNSSLTQTIKNITTYYWLAVPPVYAGRYNGTLYICENTTQNSGISNTCT